MLKSLTILAALPPKQNPSDPPKRQTTNAPLDVSQGGQQPSLDQLLIHLQSQAQAGSDVEAQWRLRLVQLAMGRDDQSLNPSPDLSKGANRLLTALLKTAVAVRDLARSPMSTGLAALETADELRRELADQADPVVSAIALCRRVVTFGVYDEMDEADLVAGSAVQTIVYCEIRNLQSQATGDGLYETRLGTRLELLTAEGRSMWQSEEPEIVDRCRRRRMDFFIAQRVTLPPTLPAGDYVLKVLVEDKLSGRANEATYPLAISSPLSIAKGL